MSKPLLFAEILMVVGAIFGSLLLSLNIEYSKWGYVLFLMSSTSGWYVGKVKGMLSLTTMNFYFSIVNIIGCIRWFA